jgi:hypothetical protein
LRGGSKYNLKGEFTAINSDFLVGKRVKKRKIFIPKPTPKIDLATIPFNTEKEYPENKILIPIGYTIPSRIKTPT